MLYGQERLAVCGEAIDGLDAVEKAESLHPDVILLDLAMPKLNGAEAASVLRRKNPNAKIILFTMYAESLRDEVAAAVGVDLVVSKSDGLGHLLKCIYEIERRKVFSVLVMMPMPECKRYGAHRFIARKDGSVRCPCGFIRPRG